MSNALQSMLHHYLKTMMKRYKKESNKGVLDPEWTRTKFFNPRYQEVCYCFALAAEHPVLLPEEISVDEARQVAFATLEVWLQANHHRGGISDEPDQPPEVMASTYGLFAAAQTLLLLNNHLSDTLRAKATKTLRKTMRFINRTPVPVGLETRPLRYAAFISASKWLKKATPLVHINSWYRDGNRLLDRWMQKPELVPLDSGALAMALAYLTISRPEPDETDIKLWKRMVDRCHISVTPSGLYGGGAEGSIASLPVLAGFVNTTEQIPASREIIVNVLSAVHEGWYNSVLDPEVPWLTPMSYLSALAFLALEEAPENSLFVETPTTFRLQENGLGRLDMGEWQLRLGIGGTIGWMHHVPTGSTRLFGSPVGFALREGPWVMNGSRLRHPGMAGRFQLAHREECTIQGLLYSLPIPGMERPPRRIGFPWSKTNKNNREANRLIPVRKQRHLKTSNALDYKRVISMKDGALIIETHLAGRQTHRLPMIWPGGLFGDLYVDKKRIPVQRPFFERGIKEIVFSGGAWPSWTVRFDRPVDVLYDPIHLPITFSPLRYLAAAAGSFDIIATDRLHMAWRVEKNV